jgi:SAM-dependent methyltransferase
LNSESAANLYAEGDYHRERGGTPEHYVQYSLRRSVPALDWALATPGVDRVGGTAFDIGCGVGGALVHLRSRGWQVSGIEPDPELADVARERFGLDVATGLFGDDSAGGDLDLGYSCHVFEHLDGPRAVVRAAHRRLVERGGHLMVVVPTFRRARTWAWTCFSTPHTYMWTDVSLGNLLRSEGFEVVRHRYCASGDSELWLLARAVDLGRSTPRIECESAKRVRRELALVPLRSPLGLASRARTHTRTLLNDPKDFVLRLRRWIRARIETVRSRFR